ncbi:MAG: hypothetical protein JWM72_574 [Actinomycetia bacterium]|nr:hypothetical protein [Actinomycetes bacterium]
MPSTALTPSPSGTSASFSRNWTPKVRQALVLAQRGVGSDPAFGEKRGHFRWTFGGPYRSRPCSRTARPCSVTRPRLVNFADTAFTDQNAICTRIQRPASWRQRAAHRTVRARKRYKRRHCISVSAQGERASLDRPAELRVGVQRADQPYGLRSAVHEIRRYISAREIRGSDAQHPTRQLLRLWRKLDPHRTHARHLWRVRRRRCCIENLEDACPSRRAVDAKTVEHVKRGAAVHAKQREGQVARADPRVRVA